MIKSCPSPIACLWFNNIPWWSGLKIIQDEIIGSVKFEFRATSKYETWNEVPCLEFIDGPGREKGQYEVLVFLIQFTFHYLSSKKVTPTPSFLSYNYSWINFKGRSSWDFDRKLFFPVSLRSTSLLMECQEEKVKIEQNKEFVFSPFLITHNIAFFHQKGVRLYI